MGEYIRHKIWLGLWAMTLLVAAGCSSTKYVPDGTYLLDEVNVSSDNKEVKPADLNMFIRQQPNTKWFNLINTSTTCLDATLPSG